MSILLHIPVTPSKKATDLPNKWLYIGFKVPVALCHIRFYSPKACFHPHNKLSKSFIDIAFKIPQALPSLVKFHLLLNMSHTLLKPATRSSNLLT